MLQRTEDAVVLGLVSYIYAIAVFLLKRRRTA
jgi:hypothetical protein